MIRGKLNQTAPQIRQTNQAEVNRLERDFLILSREHKRSLKSVSIAKIDAARMVLNLAITSRAEKSLEHVVIIKESNWGLYWLAGSHLNLTLILYPILGLRVAHYPECTSSRNL